MASSHPRRRPSACGGCTRRTSRLHAVGRGGGLRGCGREKGGRSMHGGKKQSRPSMYSLAHASPSSPLAQVPHHPPPPTPPKLAPAPQRPAPSAQSVSPHLVPLCLVPSRPGPSLGRRMRRAIWVFTDVVFQDVGFQTISLKPLTHISIRCEVPTPSVFGGSINHDVQTPNILKHHIPELPSYARHPGAFVGFDELCRA